MTIYPDPFDPDTRVAVLIPCLNEAATIESVVREASLALPHSTVYVFDNNSTDDTAARAALEGAVVVRSRRQGKGYVVRHMFDVIEADYYVMVDGDATYPLDRAPDLLKACSDGEASMVIGTRLHDFEHTSFRRFHQLGNRLVARLISTVFRTTVTDVLSGFRVFTRDFVKSVPLRSEGFEIETELTLQALAKNFEIAEVEIAYGTRPPGSESKLSTVSDGLLVLQVLFMISKDFKPLTIFGGLGLLAAFVSLLTGSLPALEFLRTRYVRRVPLAILSAGAGVLGALLAGIGLILHTTHNYHEEEFQLWRRLSRRIDSLDSRVDNSH